MDNTHFLFDAFISYRHIEPDRTIAERLHKLLETYRVPSYLVKMGAPRHLKRVFLDRSELPTDSNLSESIQKNLEASRFLIVVCSPRTLESKWVLKEVETFIRLGRRDRILTLLVDGEPAESFPPILRFIDNTVSDLETSEVHEELEEIEPLAADVRADSLKGSLRKLSVEKLRLLAPIIGCTFDELWQRHKRRQKQQRILLALCLVCVFAIMAGLGWWIQEKKALEKDRLNVSTEVINNIISLDNRLVYVYETMDIKAQNDEFTRQMHDKRENVAPSLNDVLDIKYQQVLINQQVASLQQAINATPLRTDYGNVLGAAVLHSGINQEEVRAFFDQLKEVEYTTGLVIEAMQALGTQDPDDKARYEYNRKRLDIEIAKLNNRSEIAYIDGLLLLNSMDDKAIPQYTEWMQNLNKLSPQQMISYEQAASEKQKLLEEAQKLLNENEKLLDMAKELKKTELNEYEEKMNKMLAINPDDNFAEVAGKAKSARQLGRIDDAVAAYKKYKEMFTDTDPSASLYSEIGCLLSVQAKTLGVDGGVFICQVNAGSPAETAGIQAGDIIVSYGNTVISDPDIFVQSSTSATEGTNVKLGYLRRNSQNILQLYKVEVPAGKIGVVMRNI